MQEVIELFGEEMIGIVAGLGVISVFLILLLGPVADIIENFYGYIL